MIKRKTNEQIFNDIKTNQFLIVCYTMIYLISWLFFIFTFNIIILIVIFLSLLMVMMFGNAIGKDKIILEIRCKK